MDSTSSHSFDLSELDERVLEFLADELNRLHMISKVERGVLHDREWKRTDEPTLLLELEDRVSTLAGVIRTWLSNKCIDLTYSDQINEIAIQKYAPFVAFLGEAEHYPAFASYLQTFECLRAQAWRLLCEARAPTAESGANC